MRIIFSVGDGETRRFCPGRLGLTKLTVFSLAQLEVEGYGAFVAAAGLELDRVALVQILELHARREAAAMDKDVVDAVVWNDEAKALISDNFFYRSGHIRRSSLLS
ncbi:MAG: hypothetical protein ACREQP_15180, partial [Candidatus Binatia bacterium]